MRYLLELHRDESGLETVQSVALLAVAAIVLAVLKEAWYDIKEWFRNSVRNVVDWQGDLS